MSDWSKKFQPKTRGGWDYEIFAERLEGKITWLYGRVQKNCAAWFPCGWAISSCGWTISGLGMVGDKSDSSCDLIPIPPEPIRRTVYLKRHPINGEILSDSQSVGDDWTLIACAEVEFQPVDHD